MQAAVAAGGPGIPALSSTLSLEQASPPRQAASRIALGQLPKAARKSRPNRADSFPNGVILKPMKSVSSSDVVMDVSNVDSYATSHIKNAIHIPSKNFLNGEGNLKTDEELAKVLGDAGISIDDSVVLYASKESSGEAEFAFLVLRHLGQKDVKLLDGNLADWKAAGLPEEAWRT